ncbi:Dolichyl N-acetyl-alpha-D-glucosaminyl phosphate 3-beta-D-2,3-diacetamido-2,3-dideoxy-beta-D-glucuronosyltransferase [uncultured archaeon]|nr:Dolichyl N-acetyl-alpha-D-glucosaminyl phosphate 3-beta-D-2,3-diacetamido-2,3-dideoxy-beta-D-glucuronosyltransferase [uncultured archaeon]
MKKPKVSIIIPTYNQSVYVCQTIESALAQNYENLEIVLSDDNSKDKTKEISKKYLRDKRFKYFKNKKNLGRVGNYHKALYDYSTGDYALVLDGDDYLIDNDYIKNSIDLILKYNLIAVFAKQNVLLEKDKKIIEDRMNNKLPTILEGNWLFLNYYKGYSIPHLSTIYDRKYAMKIGYYNEDILSSDWESFLRLIQKNKIGFINKSIGIWRKHLNNSSKSKDLYIVFNNIKYVENSYKFALNNKLSSKKILDNWRKNMLRRNFIKNLLKFLIIKDKESHKEFNKMIKKYDKKIYYSILFDPRFMLIKILLFNKLITKIFFKYILKNESFLEDLIIS